MLYKSSLHIHTSEDKVEGVKINYNIYKLIDQAAALDFKVLALTCHEIFTYKPEYSDYAKTKGILLIPGIEATVRDKEKKCHVLILNCTNEAEKVINFATLKEYRTLHPESLIIAAHPNFGFGVSLGLKRLKQYIDLFDVLEYSWFYIKGLNYNKATEKIAQEFNKPMIMTGDLHSLKYLNTDYSLIDAEELKIENIFTAIKNNKIKNITRPKSLVELFIYIIKLFSGKA